MTKWILAVGAVAALALAPMSEAAAKTAPHKPAPHPAANAAATNAAAANAAATVSVLPVTGITANPPALTYYPFVQPKTLPCVQLSGTTWTLTGTTSLCGVDSAFDQSITAYPGIQYATAPRWGKPTPNQLAASVSVNNFGPVCPQPAAQPNQNEQCLYLNVWVPSSSLTPKPANGYPVMVFIHGGAFITGAGSLPVYDGTSFAKNGVILVTLNYRLGALGFLDASGFGATATGNYGILDQRMAMQWVSQNIAAFGGDITHITIFGESAGAMSVAVHLYDSPGSKGYFTSAIMESNPVGLVYQQEGSVGPATIGGQFLTAMCKQLAGAFSCGKNSKFDAVTAAVTPAQIAALETSALGNTSDLTNGYMGIRGLPFAPVINQSNDTNSVVVGQPVLGYASGMPAKPTLFGINRDEGAVFAAFVAAAVAKKIPFAKPQNMPLGLVYDKAVNGAFAQDLPNPALPTDAADYFAGLNPGRYAASSGNPTDYVSGKTNTYYNAYGQDASNIVLDYDFAIGNVVLAGNAAATGVPAYAYYFDEAPLWDVYGSAASGQWTEADNGACDPQFGAYVCHGSELPYVFNTLQNVAPPILSIKVPQPNLTLAQKMNAAWASFASNPSGPTDPDTGASWPAYASNPTGAGAVELNDKLPSNTVPIDPNKVYAVWQPWLVASILPPISPIVPQTNGLMAHGPLKKPGPKMPTHRK